jgi:hypothetical protein
MVNFDVKTLNSVRNTTKHTYIDDVLASGVSPGFRIFSLNDVIPTSIDTEAILGSNPNGRPALLYKKNTTVLQTLSSSEIARMLKNSTLDRFSVPMVPYGTVSGQWLPIVYST